MGIQINGQTDTISATDGSFTISGASGNLTGNLTGNVTGNLTGDVTGNLTGTASTATSATTAYGLSGSPTLSGITSVSTTNLTVNGNAYPTAGPLSNRNLIINGAMQVAQRGTSATNSGYGSVDRFDNLYAFGTVTQSQESLASGDPYTEGFRNYLRLTNTSAGTDDAAEYRTIRHYIEAQNMAGSGWNYTSSSSYLTISFWARSSVSGTYYTLVRSHDGTTQAYTFSYTLTADTWTKVSHSIPGATSVAFDNDNNKGLDIRFLVDYGTNNTDSGHTLNTWSAWSNTSQSPDFTHDWSGTADATFDLTGVQLEVGFVATPFEHRSYGDELRRCQRYYYKIQAKASNTSAFFANAHNRSSTSAIGVTQFPVEMRTSPTALEQSGTASDYSVNHGNVQTACSSVPTWFESDTFAARTNFTTSGSLTDGEGCILRSASTDAYLAWSAEL